VITQCTLEVRIFQNNHLVGPYFEDFEPGDIICGYADENGLRTDHLIIENKNSYCLLINYEDKCEKLSPDEAKGYDFGLL